MQTVPNMKKQNKMIGYNPVAKYSFVFNKNKVEQDKTKYNRKHKHSPKREYILSP
jgi:hypothetical protein